MEVKKICSRIAIGLQQILRFTNLTSFSNKLKKLFELQSQPAKR